MTLPSKALTDLLGERPTRLTAGKAAAPSRRAGRGSKAEKMLNDYADSARSTAAPETYDHPADGPPLRRTAGPLSPSELAWVERTFPPGVAPADVTHDDAHALASLGSGLDSQRHPADARLVASVWKPIGEHHDGRAAEVEARNASEPTVPIPSSALPAVAESIAAEHPQLRPHEAFARAGEQVDAAASMREHDRQASVAEARRRIDTAGRPATWPAPVTL